MDLVNLKPTTKDILDLNLWEVVGLELDQKQIEYFQQMMDERVFADFIDRDLEDLIGKAKVEELTAKMKKNSENLDYMVSFITKELAKSQKDFDTEVQNAARKTYEEFIDFQLNFATEQVNKLPDKKEEALALIDQLRKLQVEKKWEEMGVVFKQLETIFPEVSKSLVTHL